MKLTSSRALELASQFSIASNFMQDRGPGHETRSNICDLAIRVALLKAQSLVQHEQATPYFGENPQSAFATA